MKQIIQYIEDHNISEEEVAQAAHMSLRNLRRQIHSKNRTQVRIVLLLADKQNQSIDSIFFDEMNNQPISLEGLTLNHIQDTEIKTKFLVIHRIVPDIVYKGI